MKYILEFKGNFPAQDYYDLTEELQRLRLIGTYAEPEVMTALKLSLTAISDIITYLKNLDTNEFSSLFSLIPGVVPDKNIIQAIDRIVDEKGEIRDKASDKLAQLRRDVKSKLSSANHRIGQLLTSARKDGFTGDDTELALRNGRLVIPVSAANKRKIPGYIHDTSATGQTVFIEPAEVFEINNEVQNLRIEEKQEIISILIGFADQVRAAIPDLLLLYAFLSEIDFVRACASLAIRQKALKPVLTDTPGMRFRNAIHPLLEQNLKKQGKSIVAQDIFLDSEQRILIISGPNAGGKSVCLKTAGLLQYMLQCGLLIPVNADSEGGIFKKIFLEIGDEQSLENDLSTYSSHLIHIRSLLENADAQTLFLIDEFGAGTEPQMGGAMAEASLEKLSASGSYGIVTTHYANLKLMAGNQPGIVNGAMLFDTNLMKPLFKLSIGKPGSSFAMEIARKIGFPDEVLKNATQKSGTSQLDFEEQLARLEFDKASIERQKAEMRSADETLAALVEKYEKLVQNLELQKATILKEARNKASHILSESNRLIENTVRKIRESNAERETILNVREQIETEKEALLKDDTEPLTQNPAPVIIHKPAPEQRPSGPLKAGMLVKMEGQETVGIIDEIKGNQATVLFGVLKIRTKVSNLLRATPSEKKTYEANKRFSKPTVNVIHQLNDKMAEFKMSIDIRGKKAEEAQEIIARYIDQATLLRVHEVRILHGKGDGILRNILHSYLRDVPEVERYEDESLERGGHGVTLVYFR